MYRLLLEKSYGANNEWNVVDVEFSKIQELRKIWIETKSKMEKILENEKDVRFLSVSLVAFEYDQDGFKEITDEFNFICGCTWIEIDSETLSRNSFFVQNAFNIFGILKSPLMN